MFVTDQNFGDSWCACRPIKVTGLKDNKWHSLSFLVPQTFATIPEHRTLFSFVSALSIISSLLEVIHPRGGNIHKNVGRKKPPKEVLYFCFYQMRVYLYMKLSCGGHAEVPFTRQFCSATWCCSH